MGEGGLLRGNAPALGARRVSRATSRMSRFGVLQAGACRVVSRFQQKSATRHFRIRLRSPRRSWQLRLLGRSGGCLPVFGFQSDGPRSGAGRRVETPNVRLSFGTGDAPITGDLVKLVAGDQPGSEQSVRIHRIWTALRGKLCGTWPIRPACGPSDGGAARGGRVGFRLSSLVPRQTDPAL
jgi:hypothetical protein